MLSEALPAGEAARTRHGRVAREYALVLEAVGVPCEIVQIGGEHVIATSAADVGRAQRELAEYDDENRGWRRTEELPLALENGWIASLVWIFGLLALHASTLARGAASAFAKGRGDSVRIWEGEPWRAWTALGLHADAGHLLGNAFLGALLVALVAELLGVGVGLFAVFGAGALANLLNAAAQGEPMRFVGASTAVFAALGILGGHRWQRRKSVRRGANGAWIPLLASAFLLGFLGSGGNELAHEFSGAQPQRIDVVGHALGFVVGLGVGALFARAMGVRRAAPKVQAWSGFALALAWCVAWALALNVGS